MTLCTRGGKDKNRRISINLNTVCYSSYSYNVVSDIKEISIQPFDIVLKSTISNGIFVVVSSQRAIFTRLSRFEKSCSDKEKGEGGIERAERFRERKDGLINELTSVSFPDAYPAC